MFTFGIKGLILSVSLITGTSYFAQLSFFNSANEFKYQYVQKSLNNAQLKINLLSQEQDLTISKLKYLEKLNNLKYQGFAEQTQQIKDIQEKRTESIAKRINQEGKRVEFVKTMNENVQTINQKLQESLKKYQAEIKILEEAEKARLSTLSESLQQQSESYQEKIEELNKKIRQQQYDMEDALDEITTNLFEKVENPKTTTTEPSASVS